MEKYTEKEKLTKFFVPESIAVIGASRTPNKIGHEILKNAVIQGYAGKLYPVNPKAEEILGIKSYASMQDIPGDVDLAIITVPAKMVEAAIHECGQKSVPAMVIVTSGFGEMGPEGKEHEKRIVSLAKSYGIRVIGPNTMGLKNTSNNMDVAFPFGMPYRGPISVVSQSGALGIGMIYHTIKEKLGLSKLISIGNKADVDDAEMVDMLNDDPDTSVIAFYIEGIADGRKFMESVKRCNKPIVAVKSGKTDAGAKASSSHTGSLAGKDRIYEAAFRQAGIIRARDITELFDFARVLSSLPPAKGNRVGIISNGGGAAILLTDASEENGLEVTENLSADTYARLRAALPAFVQARNPCDLTGDAGFERYRATLSAMMDDEGVDGIIITLVNAGLARPKEFAAAIEFVLKQKGKIKPVIACWIGGKEIEEVQESLKDIDVPVFPDTERAVNALRSLVEYGRFNK